MLVLGILLLQASCSIAQSNSTVSVESSVSATNSVSATAPSPSATTPSAATASVNASASLSQNSNGSGNVQASQSTSGLQGTAGASTGATLTLEVPSSMFSPSATAGQQTSTTQDSQLDLQPTAGECDNLDWTPTAQPGCSTKECIKNDAAKLEKLSKCQESKPANVSTFSIVSMVEMYGKQLAQHYQANNKSVNDSGIIFNDQFIFGSGVVDGITINSTSIKHVSYPDYSNPDHFTDKWQQLRDEIKIPTAVLRGKGLSSVLVTWSVFPDLFGFNPLSSHDLEMDHNRRIADSLLSDMYVDDRGKLITRKKFADIVINSNIFTFTFFPSLGKLSEPVVIMLRHKKIEGYQNPRCVFWDTNKRIFSSDGCEVRETNSTHTACACKHATSFAVAMKAKILEDSSDRELVVTIAWVLSSISLLCLLLCGICIIVIGYYNVDNMRIALNLDVALILSHLVFYIGLSTNQTNFYSNESTCEVISPLVHLFQLAALTWLLMEGLHYVSKFKKIFNPENAQPWFIYASAGWGIPIAFAAACAGYTYPHFGTPKHAEFCWPSIEGTGVWYFGVPMLILVLLNCIVRGVVLKEVLMWKGDPDDINIERTRYRLLSFIVLLPVVIMTWLFGVLANNNSEDKVYHYVFIAFYTLQGILVALFYCAKNAELWDFQREKKEAKMKEKNAVFNFQYIP